MTSQPSTAINTLPREALIAPAVSGNLAKWVNAMTRRLKVTDQFHFDDRRSGSPVLVCMLAGYKPELWRFVMPRFERALPDADVCLVSPGLRNGTLSDLSRRAGWSYLSTATNDVSLAQNVCYRLHAKAELIVKLDEDMLLVPDSLSALISQYRGIKAQGIVDPGFVAPMIPVNGFCYRPLLEILGLLDEFEARFRRARIAYSGTPIQDDPAAACWMWERTAPLEQTARRLAAKPVRTLFCPIQFSTGLIAFERSFWEMIGHLPVCRRRLVFGLGTHGADERHISAQAFGTSRPGVITTGALAGHFAFEAQHAGVIPLMERRPELFAPSTA
jgi:hypothetical protein